MSELQLILSHWPFALVALILAVIGRVMDERVLTRERAYTWRKGLKVAPAQPWYWLRETMPLHPILLGVLIGAAVVDPEGRGWGRGLSVLYFAGAGAVSLGLWVYLVGSGKLKALRLPGESDPPGPGG